jgi:hypothetical protein
MRTTTTAPSGTTADARPNLWPAVWRTGVAAALAGGVVSLLATASGVVPVVRTATGTDVVGLADVLLAAVVVTLLGWAVRALLRRVTGDGRVAWLVVCGVVGLVSLVGPLAATTLAATSFLVAAHVSVGSAVAVGLARPDRYPRCR